ncbi:hypothetical protein BBO99_00004144 [Phytophthora kernoviae]|uniref:WW domain-containing protein n=1 Tax=Phytophthora kernoviae TaxID=325452 RepID=A0A421GS65_9STRA|nr:hypothetical protein BBI17_004320 [Phytophthora kernoviae]RLN80940.1 hypothetical protein BBO99_00004144 [Phytophthora kernoviae]
MDDQEEGSSEEGEMEILEEGEEFQKGEVDEEAADEEDGDQDASENQSDTGEGDEADEEQEEGIQEEDEEEDGDELGEEGPDVAEDQDEESEKEAEPEMTPMEAAIASILDKGCTEVLQKLTGHMQIQGGRLLGCEQRVKRALQKQQEFVTKQEQTLEQAKLERNTLQAKIELLETRLRQEQEERAEESEWLAELWPDGVPPPTLLVPLRKAAEARHKSSQESGATTESVNLVKDLQDNQERQRLEALVTRRVEREHVRRKLEEASHWKLVLPEPSADENDGSDQMAYFTNTLTGVSVWDAPVAMLFEPPPGWDLTTMDWEVNYRLENFYPGAHRRALKPNNVENDENDDGGANSDDENSTADASNDHSRKDDEEEEDDDNDEAALMDPMPARERFEEEIKRYSQLKSEVEQSAAKQRSLAMEVLTAQRELCEREQEQLKEEDAVVMAVERKRRNEEREEQAAAKAKAEAERRKAQQTSTGKSSAQPVFGRDSVAKKGLTLAANDQAFEQELREFAEEQRADRLYLSTPLTRDARVRERYRLDPEYVHMKHVESRVLGSEKHEFTLLEKSSLRDEEATAKAADLRNLCRQIREQQHTIEEEFVQVEASIARLKTEALLPPELPRPTEEELARAAERFLTVDPLTDDDEDGGKDENDLEDSRDDMADDRRKEDDVGKSEAAEYSISLPVVTSESDKVATAPFTPPIVTATINAPSIPSDDERMKMDEAELRELKAFTNSEREWRNWEKVEKARTRDLNEALAQYSLLVTSRKQLAMDLVLYEDGDAPFFEQLRDLEKAANKRMWDLQAQTQVVRARFVIERAAREESVFQMRDRLKELQQQLKDAYSLRLQALHPLERVELQDQSKKLVATLHKQEAELQARYKKEEEAKELLMQLELRSCDYADAKLQEEMKLFAEKQELWDLNLTLVGELQNCRQTMECLNLQMQQNEPTEHKLKPQQGKRDASLDSREVPKDINRITVKGDVGNEAPASRDLYEENARLFETKRQYLQQVRRFLLMCYDREDRWRALTGGALIKDTTSDDWMTRMQQSRHEDTLKLLQAQHDEQQQGLQRQIKLLSKVKVGLQAQIEALGEKMLRLQCDYQAASENVRLQTQEVIKALREEIEEGKAVLEKEKLQFRSDHEQLIREHDAIREELEERLQDIEDVMDKQVHWLTAAKRELKAQRVANEELLKAYQSLEKRRAAEVNDMRFRISAQIKKINNIEMWNLSMKISAKEAHVDLMNMQKDLEKQRQQHKQLQRGLRLQNWRHRVTAQTILTDANLLFAFFADGIAILAGTTPEINDTLRENAGIEVMAALAQHSNQQAVRAICARALGQLSWNANVTARSLGWKAKKKWFQWMKTQSSAILDKLEASNTAFDAVADEEAGEANWLADPSAFVDDISGEVDHDMSAKGGRNKAKKLLFAKTWQQFDDKAYPDTNVANQQIHDTIDLEISELIQTYASQVIANVITLLDREDNESDNRSICVADIIVEEQSKLSEYSGGIGSVAKKLDHDNQRQHGDQSSSQQPPKYAGVATFVLMCASCNRDVAFHGAIVLGSIAQHDVIRAAIGAASGMDALFLLAARTDDLPMVAQATWALANLTWNRDNQYRVARYLDHLYQLCTLSPAQMAQISMNQQEVDPQEQEMHPEDPVARVQRKQHNEQIMQQIREHGLCILANSLFYNDDNRQLVASRTDWMQLLARNALNADSATLENSARALCSLSYSDSIALRMGSTVIIDAPNTSASKSVKTTTSMNGLHVFIRLCSRAENVTVQQHGLFGVINMCLHDSNKTKLLEVPHGIDTLVNLSGHMNKELCDPALEALELLSDLRQLKQDHGILQSQAFESVDMKKLISLLSEATNPTLVSMVSDAIADEVWKKPSAQVRLRNEHGLEKLLEICVKQPPLFAAATSDSSPAAAAEIERRVLISCLWALRNTVANNVRNQDLVGALCGVQQLVNVFDRERQNEEVVEALLAVLVALVMKHPRNSQQLVQFGLDMLIGLADESGDGDRLEEDRRSSEQRGVTLPRLTRTAVPSPSKLEAGLGAYTIGNGTGKQLENATLARELLHMVAAYNTREESKAPLSPDAKVRKMQQLQSSASPLHRRKPELHSASK